MEKNRIEAFSDGVFAIAVTLLILEIKIPHVPLEHLGDALLLQVPKILAFILSFVIIGVYWVSHHNMMHYVEKVDRNALWLNMLVLMCVAFIPFPTALLGEYPYAPLPAMAYGLTLAVVNLMGALFWLYCAGRLRLVHQNLNPRFGRTVAILHSAPIVFYLVAIALAPFAVVASYAIYIAVPLFFILPNPLLARFFAKPWRDPV